MVKLIRMIMPPPQWRLPVLLLMGVIVGVGLVIVHASRAHSYLSDKPETCINCHVMFPSYATWSRSSHREVATCSDCHVPHDNILQTYFFKAKDGFRHASVFTARAEPQVIEIKQAGINVVQQNCIRCHSDMVSMTRIIEVTGRSHLKSEGMRCWDCHRDVPHGTVRSLSSTPHSLVPRLPSVMPEWLKEFIKEDQ